LTLKLANTNLSAQDASNAPSEGEDEQLAKEVGQLTGVLLKEIPLLLPAIKITIFTHC
jgi:hypothetical protein